MNKAQMNMHITVDASAIQEQLDKILSIVTGVKESVGVVIDHLDAGIQASKLPWSPELHIVGMRGVMQQAIDDLRAAMNGGETA